MKIKASAMTLIELLISIVLLSLIVLGAFGIELFSRFQLIASERRTAAQNAASYVLEHMAKNVSLGIGSNAAGSPAVIKNSPNEWIKVRWDRPPVNGQPDDNGPNDWIAYRYVPADYKIEYYATYPYAGWPVPPALTPEALSQKITNFVCSIEYNYLFVEITACNDPDATPFACGTIDNPSVTMRTRIKIPAFSYN